MPTASVQPAQGTAQGTTNWGAIGSSNLVGGNKDIYDKLYKRTQQEAARNLKTAQTGAATQAAMAGYSPEAAARLADKAMAGTYGANQQAGQALAQTENELKEKQKRGDREFIESLKDTNPNAYKAALNAFMTGGDVAAAIDPFLDRGTGQLKVYDEFDAALDQESSEWQRLEDIMNSPDASDEKKALAYQKRLEKIFQSVKPENLGNPTMAARFKQLSAAEKAKWAETNGVANLRYNGDDGIAKKLHQNEGKVVLINGEPFMVTSSGNEFFDEAYDKRKYSATIQSLETGQSRYLEKQMRASSWGD